jgi:trimethylamine--corrinoid protein Co-methyltransferase
MAVDVIGEVGPGSHFIDHLHTLENYRSEFSIGSLFESPVYESDGNAGARDIVYAAQEKAQTLLDAYEMPPMDPGMREQLDEYVKMNWADT